MLYLRVLTMIGLEFGVERFLMFGFMYTLVCFRLELLQSLIFTKLV